MGTTSTTNLGLIKPDLDEKIKEDLPTYQGWATQNGLNCDIIDGLFRNSSHTWTPSWTADSVNPTLGASGLVEGKYRRVLPRMVIGFFRIYTGGAGFAAGTGNYQITAPVAPASEFNSFNNEVPIGRAGFYDDSAAASSSAFTVMYSTSSGLLFFRSQNNDSWSNTNPVALGQQDRVTGYFMYPTSAA